MAIIPKLLAPTMFDDFEMDVVQEFKTDYSLEITENPVETGFRNYQITYKELKRASDKLNRIKSLDYQITYKELKHEKNMLCLWQVGIIRLPIRN